MVTSPGGWPRSRSSPLVTWPLDTEAPARWIERLVSRSKEAHQQAAIPIMMTAMTRKMMKNATKDCIGRPTHPINYVARMSLT